MDNSFIILAFILGVLIGSVVTIVTIALTRGNEITAPEPPIVATPDDLPPKKKPSRPKKVKQL